MFIIIRDPNPNPATFADELGKVIETVYADEPSAQGDAMTLAAANPGSTYVVFELVQKGMAVVTLAPIPPAVWTPL